MITEKSGFSANGYIALSILLLLQLGFASVMAIDLIVLASIGSLMTLIMWLGFFTVQPNQGKVMTLFGRYVGTVKQSGLRWTIPLFSRKSISLRTRNFESAQIKVNDLLGNPIEIAAIVVWSVTDTAEAVFEVEDYENYVTIQSEAALRNLAGSYVYDPHDSNDISLLSHPSEIANQLKLEIQNRLTNAGLTIQEARISHLAYSQEIASAMLQRQQATAIIAARSKIVEGAVGMVEMALERLKEQNVVELDEERKAAMVSNLLVVLCGDKAAQPVVNTGTIY